MRVVRGGERRDQSGCTGACNQQLADSNGVTCRYSCLMALVKSRAGCSDRGVCEDFSVAARSVARNLCLHIERHETWSHADERIWDLYLQWDVGLWNERLRDSTTGLTTSHSKTMRDNDHGVSSCGMLCGFRGQSMAKTPFSGMKSRQLSISGRKDRDLTPFHQSALESERLPGVAAFRRAGKVRQEHESPRSCDIRRIDSLRHSMTLHSCYDSACASHSSSLPGSIPPPPLPSITVPTPDAPHDTLHITSVLPGRVVSLCRTIPSCVAAIRIVRTRVTTRSPVGFRPSGGKVVPRRTMVVSAF